MHINNCSAPVIIEHLNMRDSRQRLAGNGLHPALIYARHCKLLDVTGCKLNCNGVSADAVQADYTTAHFWSSQVSNAYAAFGITAGTGFIESVSGNPTISMECTAGHIFCVGQVPNGTRKRTANGVIYDTGISTGTGTTQPSVTPESRMTLQASLTRSYQGGWRSDTYDLVQGLYSSSGYLSSLSWNYGCMWFGTLRSSLSGRTVRSATLTLKRKDGGSAGMTNLWLHGISNTTNSGACVSNINHGQVCSIARGSTIMFAIPASAVQRLISGADGGLCLFESPYNFGGSAYSQNYCRIVGTDGDVRPVLNVVYV